MPVRIIPQPSRQLVNSPSKGPTQTGEAPWLAQTNVAPFTGVSYIPNTPLETQVPIHGNVDNRNIFERLGNLSPYFPNPRGFGVKEYPMPPGSNATWVNIVHRHGSRYPEAGGREITLAKKIMDAKGRFTAYGPLSFLHDWRWMGGAEILVPVGKQQLFDSGTLHYYQYGHLFPNNGSKIIARSTTQRRMLESAEYFLAGFFGLGWTQNATLELIIESDGFNNTMAGYKACNRSNWDMTGKRKLRQQLSASSVANDRQLRTNGRASISQTLMSVSRRICRETWIGLLRIPVRHLASRNPYPLTHLEITLKHFAPMKRSASAFPTGVGSSPMKNGKDLSIRLILALL